MVTFNFEYNLDQLFTKTLKNLSAVVYTSHARAEKKLVCEYLHLRYFEKNVLRVKKITTVKIFCLGFSSGNNDLISI